MDGYLLACSVLLSIALVLNVPDRRMLLLTALVGVGFFWPPPQQSQAAFYSFAIATETAVCISALFVGRKAGTLIAELAVLLVCAHVMGWALDGHPPGSPYHLLVKLLETSQILVCVVLSPVIVPILRSHGETTT